jgi:hypothetical protein
MTTLPALMAMVFIAFAPARSAASADLAAVEGYTLTMKAENAQTVAYRYAVTAIVAGVLVVRAGVVERLDAPGGPASTSIRLDFGGAATSFTAALKNFPC